MGLFKGLYKKKLSQVKKLREATYTAAVCKFWGGHVFFWFGSECGTAQFSLFLFPLIPAAAYVHLDAWCDPIVL